MKTVIITWSNRIIAVPRTYPLPLAACSIGLALAMASVFLVLMPSSSFVHTRLGSRIITVPARYEPRGPAASGAFSVIFEQAALPGKPGRPPLLTFSPVEDSVPLNVLRERLLRKAGRGVPITRSGLDGHAGARDAVLWSGASGGGVDLIVSLNRQRTSLYADRDGIRMQLEGLSTGLVPRWPFLVDEAWRMLDRLTVARLPATPRAPAGSAFVLSSDR